MKTIATITSLTLLSLSVHAGPNFYPRGAKYKLNTVFHFVINGVPAGDCPTELRGRVTPVGWLRIDGWTSDCLAVDNLPRTGYPVSAGMGSMNMDVTYQSQLCGGSLQKITVSETGAFMMYPTSDVSCNYSINGQFLPLIKIVP